METTGSKFRLERASFMWSRMDGYQTVNDDESDHILPPHLCPLSKLSPVHGHCMPGCLLRVNISIILNHEQPDGIT